MSLHLVQTQLRQGRMSTGTWASLEMRLEDAIIAALVCAVLVLLRNQPATRRLLLHLPSFFRVKRRPGLKIETDIESVNSMETVGVKTSASSTSQVSMLRDRQGKGKDLRNPAKSRVHPSQQFGHLMSPKHRLSFNEVIDEEGTSPAKEPLNDTEMSTPLTPGSTIGKLNRIASMIRKAPTGAVMSPAPEAGQSPFRLLSPKDTSLATPRAGPNDQLLSQLYHMHHLEKLQEEARAKTLETLRMLEWEHDQLSGHDTDEARAHIECLTGMRQKLLQRQKEQLQASVALQHEQQELLNKMSKRASTHVASLELDLDSSSAKSPFASTSSTTPKNVEDKGTKKQSLPGSQASQASPTSVSAPSAVPVPKEAQTTQPGTCPPMMFLQPGQPQHVMVLGSPTTPYLHGPHWIYPTALPTSTPVATPAHTPLQPALHPAMPSPIPPGTQCTTPPSERSTPASSPTPAPLKAQSSMLSDIIPSTDASLPKPHVEDRKDSPEVVKLESSNRRMSQSGRVHRINSNLHGSPRGRPFRWRKGALLGQGGFGTVHIALNEETGDLLAVKNVDLSKSCDPRYLNQRLQQLKSEIELMRTFSHENIVQYRGTERGPGFSLNIFMEYVPGGSIANLLKSFGPLTESVVTAYTCQLLNGLQYLHDYKVIHRDIKGANILLTVDGVCKLGDFGAATYFVDLSEMHKSLCGTPNWMPPEVIRQDGHHFPADIWSLGCTVLEMLTAKPPWSHIATNPMSVLHFITSDRPIEEGIVNEFSENGISEQAVAFVIQCLQREPELRPNVVQLQRHPWLENIEEEDDKDLDSPRTRHLEWLSSVQAENKKLKQSLNLEGRSTPLIPLVESAQNTPLQRSRPDPTDGSTTPNFSPIFADSVLPLMAYPMAREAATAAALMAAVAAWCTAPPQQSQQHSIHHLSHIKRKPDFRQSQSPRSLCSVASPTHAAVLRSPILPRSMAESREGVLKPKSRTFAANSPTLQSLQDPPADKLAACAKWVSGQSPAPLPVPCTLGPTVAKAMPGITEVESVAVPSNTDSAGGSLSPTSPPIRRRPSIGSIASPKRVVVVDRQDSPVPPHNDHSSVEQAAS
eukprot:Sspe_Gene.16302::Locus_5745_Transcript_1_1_Confidence_1.000_Length_3345::g.16302::m.16302